MIPMIHVKRTKDPALPRGTSGGSQQPKTEVISVHYIDLN